MLPALKRNLPLVEPMTQEQIEKIDNASMDILEEVGVVFRDPVAIGGLETAGRRSATATGCISTAAWSGN